MTKDEIKKEILRLKRLYELLLLGEEDESKWEHCDYIEGYIEGCRHTYQNFINGLEKLLAKIEAE
ncbi:MAG: hypothetical protein IIY58_00220 [Aeriscardovia sp.]|nr:hypothetical protein [Aeriscardovia sp.]